MTNPFSEFAGSLTSDQKELLLAALNEPQVTTLKKAPKKRATKKTVAKATVKTDDEVVATPKRKPPVKKIVNSKFQVVNEDGSSAARRQPVRFRGNTWTDDGKLDKNKKTETPEYEPMAREREPVTYTNKRCHVCGRDFKVRTDLIHGEFHRCSKCI